MSDIGLKVVDLFNRMKSKRANFSSQFEDLTAYYLPDRGNILSMHAQGQAIDPRYSHPAAIEVAEKLSSRMISDLTDLALNKLVISPLKSSVGQIDDVKVWCDNTARLMRNTFMNTNTGWQSNNATATLDAVVFGTANLSVIELDDYPFVNFRAKHIGRYYIDQDHTNKINTVLEEIILSVKNAVRQFGKKKLSPKLADIFDKMPDQEVCIIKANLPSEDAQAQFGLSEGGAYTIIYVEKETGHIIESYASPYLYDTVFRWTLKTGEVYGRSPAMTALPYAKQLTALSVLENQAFQLAFKPILLATDDGVLPKTRFVPGQFLPGTIDENTGQQKLAYLQPVGDLNAFRVKEQSLILLLEKIFYTESLPDNKNVRMTELEVQARLAQLRSLSPNISRVIGEYLVEVCKKVYAILDRKKLIDPMPKELKSTQLKFDFMGALTKAYRVSELEAIQQTYSFMAAAAQYDQTVPMHFDHNIAAKHFAEIAGAPLAMIKDDAVVQQQLQAQAQQQQQLQAAQVAQMQAGSISDLQKAQQPQ